MNDSEKIKIVKQFNDCINQQNADCLAVWMSDEHIFIDRTNTVVKGKEIMKEGWREFFKSFPDYRNHFEEFKISLSAIAKLAGMIKSVSAKGCQVIIATQSTDLISHFSPESIMTVDQIDGCSKFNKIHAY